MTVSILGISAFYHDSAAALIVDGELIAAAQEERFTRKKHDAGFPVNAIDFCLSECGLRITDLDYIVFYDKPLVKFERLLETYLAYAPLGWKSFVKAMPIWLKEKLFLRNTLEKQFSNIGNIDKSNLPKILFCEHHESHAASAFYPSPYQDAAVICIDGVGEWATTSIWKGAGNSLEPLYEIKFPHSLGLLYSAFTFYAGFKVNSGEYKLMGLAPYGEPKYVDLIYKNLIDVKEDGSFKLDMSYFNYAAGLTMTSSKFHRLFGGEPRKSESVITQKEMDIARSIQVVTEEILLKLVNAVHARLNVPNLCLAGGVALNCVANGRLLRESAFDNIWIQPAAGDAGGSLGAALQTWHSYLGKERHVVDGNDSMKGSYLGNKYTNDEIREYLDKIGACYKTLGDDELLPLVAHLISTESVIGWFNGRMEFGPRSLGARSIIGDPRSPKMQSIMNLKIKFRESFRPFAPAVKFESISDWFELDESSPYMLVVSNVKQEKCLTVDDKGQNLFGIDKLNVPRSQVPAVTHVDYSARIQSVHRETNPRFHQLISCFEELTGCPVLINTSFNVRGEPIVSSPSDAYKCFMRSGMDYLVMENILLAKSDQAEMPADDSWKTEFELD